MNVILTNDQVNRLESLNETLKGAPPRVERSAESFEHVLRNPQMVEWIQGAPAAQSAAARLTRNIENLRHMTQLIRRITEENRHIVSWNRMNNNQNM